MSSSNFINHQLQILTAEIATKKQQKYEFAKLLCGDKHCQTCFGNDDLTKICANGKSVSICKVCVDLVKHVVKNDVITNKEWHCNVCGDDDGILFIPGLTNNLCKDCFSTIRSVK